MNQPVFAYRIQLAVRLIVTFACITICSLGYSAVKVGDQIEYSFRTIKNEIISQEDMNDKIVILYFWATGSQLSTDAIPHMNALYKAAEGKPVEMIGISLDSRRSTLGQYIKKHQIKWTQVYSGSKSKEAKQFGVTAIPQVFIISPDSEVLWQGKPTEMNRPLQLAYRKYFVKGHEEVAIAPKSAEAIEAEEQLKNAIRAMEQGDYDGVIQAAKKIPLDSANSEILLRDTERILNDLQNQLLVNPEIENLIASNPEIQEQILKLKKLQSKDVENDDNIDKPVKDKNQKVVNKPRFSKQVLDAKLRKALKYEEAQQLFKAYDIFLWLMDKAPQSEQGSEATSRVLSYRSDEKFMASYAIYLETKKAGQLLRTANSLAKLGESQAALDTYQQIIDDCPNAVDTVEQAKNMILKIKQAPNNE